MERQKRKKANSMSWLFDFSIKGEYGGGDGFEPSKAVPADYSLLPLATREPLRVCLTLHKVEA